MQELLKNYFIRNGVKMQVKKNSLIQRESENSGHKFVYWLEDGICALSGLTTGGEEWAYLYFRGERLVGFNKLMLSQCETADRPAFCLVAKTTCTLYRITDDIFRKLFSGNPEFGTLMLKTLAVNYDEVLVHFHRSREESAAVRLCRFLLDTSTPCGDKRVMPKFFTYDELARYLGTHPVTVSRIMASLKRNGLLTKSGREIVIEREDGLWSLIRAESSLDY